MSTNRMVSTTINGEDMALIHDDRMTLLDALRDRAGLTGTKEGCLSGDCGACSVIMNDRVVDSCLVMAAEAEGAAIVTVEGLADGTELHPLQRRFLEQAALQCGICTPGFLVTAKSLLDRNNNPSAAEIRLWLAGNLCRCTGYDKIIRAVEGASADLRAAKG